MPAQITPDVLEASFILQPSDYVVEDEVPCVACGDELEEGQQALEVRTPEFGQRAMATVHLRCYQGEEVIR